MFLRAPLFSENGSWIISARRSYLDFLVDQIEIGTSIAPVYGDIQSKFVYDLSKDHQLSLINVFGDDHSEADSEVAIENDMQNYGEHNIYQSTVGLNWESSLEQPLLLQHFDLLYVHPF